MAFRSLMPGSVVVVFRWLVLVAASFVGSGCVSYTASIQQDVQRGDVAFEIQHVVAKKRDATWVSFDVREVPKDVRLAHAVLSTDATTYCEGELADSLGRAPSKPEGTPLRAGDRISLGFRGRKVTAIEREGASLDLMLQTSQGEVRCLRVPLLEEGRDLDWEPRQRWTIGLDAILEGFPSRIGAVQQSVVLPLMVGVWLGRWHVEAGVGVGGAGCPDTECPAPSGDQLINYSNLYPVHAGVSTPLFERGEFSWGAGLQYRAMKLVADTYEGERAWWAHGPVVTTFLGGGTPRADVDDLVGGAREAFAGVELRIGYLFGPDGERSLSLGVGARMRMTAL